MALESLPRLTREAAPGPLPDMRFPSPRSRSLLRLLLLVRFRSLLRLLLLALLVPAGAASAAPIQRSFQADLALFSGLLPPLYFSGAGTATVDVVGNHVNGLTLPANVFATQTSASVPGLEVQVDAANGAGSFTSTSGIFGGVMPILGNLRVCFGGPCAAGPLLDVTLPLSVVGAGGTVSTSGGTFQVMGAPWGTAPITLAGTGFDPIFSGFQAGPGGLTSSTALPGGFLSFVTPARITIPGLGGLDFVAVLDVTLVPEPRALALLCLGLGGLAALGSPRTRGDRR